MKTADELNNRLAELGAHALQENLSSILSGDISSISKIQKQSHLQKKIKKADARIDWHRVLIISYVILEL